MERYRLLTLREVKELQIMLIRQISRRELMVQKLIKVYLHSNNVSELLIRVSTIHLLEGANLQWYLRIHLLVIARRL